MIRVPIPQLVAILFVCWAIASANRMTLGDDVGTSSTVVPSASGAESEKAVTSASGAAVAHTNETGAEKSSKTTSRKASLEEILEFANQAYDRINEEIDDYTCVLYKREYVDGKVGTWQSMELKVRHAKRKENGTLDVPFSVYLRFLKPKKVAGRAVIYVENQNNGDLIARRGGRSRTPSMTVQLIPTGPMAMEGNRYPITEIGFQNLAKRLIEVLQQELEHQDSEVLVYENAKVGDRKCTHFRLIHHQRREGLTYYMAEVSVDDELGIPIRYGAYDFPRKEGGKPQMLEQYVYTNVQLNVGLTDEDFDPHNPKYDFQMNDELAEAPSKQ